MIQICKLVMKNKIRITDTDFDEILENSLQSQGYLFPVKDQQVELFEKNTDQCNIPDEFRSPEFVFEGIRKQFNRTTVILDNTENDSNWSIAARDGKFLSPEIKAQMIKDREEARKKDDTNK